MEIGYSSGELEGSLDDLETEPFVGDLIDRVYRGLPLEDSHAFQLQCRGPENYPVLQDRTK
jgi:hypothetical protein